MVTEVAGGCWCSCWLAEVAGGWLRYLAVNDDAGG